MTDAKHEAPADTVTISRAEYEALKSGYPGDPSLLHEAPAEGAGEMDDDDASTYAPSVAGLSDYLWNQAQAADSVEGRCILEMWREAVDALRARSSAPEAREGEAVAWMRLTAGRITHLTHCEMPGYVPLYTHPATPSADKLRAVVEGFVSDLTGSLKNRSTMLTINHNALTARIDQALAALKAVG